MPLKLRLVKYDIGGTTYRLGTTLLDRDRYPVSELMDIYHARWGVEELYKVSKQHFAIEAFHAKSERGVKQEVYAHFVLITMNRLFSNEAELVLNQSDPSGPSATQSGSGGSTTPKSSIAKIQTNFKNCIHVLARGIEELLLVRDRFIAAARRTFSRRSCKGLG